MEQWEIDFSWLKVQHFIKDKLGASSLPKLESVLFIIGLQETGVYKREYSKEEKIGITNAGTMAVLSQNEYFRKTGTDLEGWPVWEMVKPYEPENELFRQNELKVMIIRYFEDRYGIADYEQS